MPGFELYLDSAKRFSFLIDGGINGAALSTLLPLLVVTGILGIWICLLSCKLVSNTFAIRWILCMHKSKPWIYYQDWLFNFKTLSQRDCWTYQIKRIIGEDKLKEPFSITKWTLLFLTDWSLSFTSSQSQHHNELSSGQTAEWLSKKANKPMPIEPSHLTDWILLFVTTRVMNSK